MNPEPSAAAVKSHGIRMRVVISSDSDWEAKIGHAVRELSMVERFKELNFGSGVLGITIRLNARDPGLAHCQRIRFSVKERILRFDVMLDLAVMTTAPHQGRRNIICAALYFETASILRRRKFPGFDFDGFLKVFEKGLQKDLRGADAARFDPLCLERAAGV